MKATIYFPEKYIEGIYSLNISEIEKENIKKTINVGKSKPCMYEIRNTEVLTTVEEVIKYKIACK